MLQRILILSLALLLLSTPALAEQSRIYTRTLQPASSELLVQDVQFTWVGDHYTVQATIHNGTESAVRITTIVVEVHFDTGETRRLIPVGDFPYIVPACIPSDSDAIFQMGVSPYDGLVVDVEVTIANWETCTPTAHTETVFVPFLEMPNRGPIEYTTDLDWYQNPEHDWEYVVTWTITNETAYPLHVHNLTVWYEDPGYGQRWVWLNLPRELQVGSAWDQTYTIPAEATVVGMAWPIVKSGTTPVFTSDFTVSR